MSCSLSKLVEHSMMQTAQYATRPPLPRSSDVKQMFRSDFIAYLIHLLIAIMAYTVAYK